MKGEPLRADSVPKLSSMLTIDDILEAIGTHPADHQERLNERRKVIRRLRNIEEATGQKVIMGKGGRGGYWTTRQALRAAWPHLIDDREETVKLIQSYLRGFMDDFELLKAKVEVMAAEVKRLKRAAG